MDTHAKAMELAKRPYLIMTSVEETTKDKPIYFARVLEMDGCFGQGKTRELAIKDLHLAMVDFIESLLEDGLPVPEPARLESPTAKTTVDSTLTYVNVHGKAVPQKYVRSADYYVMSIHE